ncbi:response regulator transcription factor [Patescibacteria group bacterium]|nr:response regulator transcription factor [Patescibacteria group bacterium]
MRTLVIEDEKEIGKFIKKGLENQHYSVDLVTTAKEGIKLGTTHDYDIIVIDINLPDGSGIDICKAIRDAKKTASIIMLTVRIETDTKVSAFDAGADDYLTKPFSMEELHARIRAMLRREKQIKSDKLVVGKLELDTKKHTVAREGKKIELRKKEFELLEYLMRNEGVVLTRAMILEHVWDLTTDPFTNTVDVHMRHLRKKVDEKFKKKLIKTVHGSGYKIEG